MWWKDFNKMLSDIKLQEFQPVSESNKFVFMPNI